MSEVGSCQAVKAVHTSFINPPVIIEGTSVMTALCDTTISTHNAELLRDSEHILDIFFFTLLKAIFTYPSQIC